MAETLVEMAKRLCNENCVGDSCPVHEALHGWGYNSCVIRLLTYTTTASEQIATLQDWAAANPPKTYKDVLLEKFPNATAKSTEHYGACRISIFGGECPITQALRNNLDYVGQCDKCWDESYKEAAHGN